MMESHTDSAKIRKLLKNARTDKINDHEIFMKGIDYSYYYTEHETATIITQLRNISGSDYDANKRMLDLICNGFTFRREDTAQKDFFIQLIDFESPERIFFGIVNQVEIQGREQGAHRMLRNYSTFRAPETIP